MAQEPRDHPFDIPRGLITVANALSLSGRLLEVAKKWLNRGADEYTVESDLRCMILDAGDRSLPWNEALQTNKPIHCINVDFSTFRSKQEHSKISINIELESWESSHIVVKAAEPGLVDAIAQAIREFADAPTPGLLWHYTSWKGLEGIIKDNELWSSSAAYLNDTQEIKQALEFIKRMVEVANHEILMESLSGPYRHIVPERWYVTSLSAKADDLGQWRGYTESNLRFAIGFDRGRLSNVANSWGWTLVECAYEIADKEALVQPIISTLDRSREAGHHSRPHAYNENQYRAVFELSGVACRMKDLCFKDEAEQRLVKQVGREDRSAKQDRKEKYAFRQTGSLAIPYLKMPLRVKDDIEDNDADHPITEVMIGPGPQDHRRLNMETVNKLLCAHKRKKVRVLASRVPFRTY